MVVVNAEFRGIGNRLRAVREEAKLTQKELAEALNSSSDTVLRWEKNKSSPSLEDVIKIAKITNTSVAYLAGETDESFQDTIQVFRDQVLVPVYANLTACCGAGIDNCTTGGEIEQYIPLPREQLGYGDCYGIYVTGTSMELANIPEGSVAVINSSRDAQNGDPCHVQYIKYGFPVDAIKFFYRKTDGTVILKAANGSGVPDIEFPPEKEEVADQVMVCGVVISVITMTKPRIGV